MNRQFMSCAILSASLITVESVGAGGFGTEGGLRQPDATSQIIVRLSKYQGAHQEQGISASQLERLKGAAGFELRRVRVMSDDARVLVLPREMTQAEVVAIADKIAAVPGVVYAVADRIMQPVLSGEVVPNDPLYPQQWHYSEPTGGINLPAAWDITVGLPSVNVAVIDTGIRGGHEDLAGQWAGGYDFISMKFNARDGDGRDPDPTDVGDYTFRRPSSWHGTHVAGTIGAATDNGIGVAGIAHGATIQPVRVLGRLGGFTSDILDAMRWSAGLSVPGIPDNPSPARVLNMSLGGAGVCDEGWQGAVDDVVNAGSVLVVAAGNNAKDASQYTPAGCDYVITVGATGRTGDLASYSNFGSTVEISAPGGDNNGGILSTLDSGTKAPKGDAYGFYQGTSMATPHVAGVVALMFSVNPKLTPGEVLQALQDSARPFLPGTSCAVHPGLCGVGIVDAYAALQRVQPPL